MSEKISLNIGNDTSALEVPAAVFATFTPDGVEILRIDREGIVYKGKRVEDAGEAHRAFVDAMGRLGVPEVR